VNTPIATFTPSLPKVSIQPGLEPFLDTLITPQSTLGSDPAPAPAPDKAGGCEPCEKSSKSEEKKQRTQCYVQLIKQATDPSNDTIRNWRKIKCR
jgi:hypothetical protein